MSCTETEEHKESGEVLLAFHDETGCRVTLKVQKALLGTLAARLAAPPDKPDPG